MKGEVVDKKETEFGAEVHLKVRVENQWGTVVSPGEAVVLLPKRDKPVDLPRPAEEDIDKMIAHEVERYRARDTGLTFDS